MDKNLLRGSIFCILSVLLSVYEILTNDVPRFPLLAGYTLTFCFGVFVILSRNTRPKKESRASKKQST